MLWHYKVVRHCHCFVKFMSRFFPTYFSKTKLEKAFHEKKLEQQHFTESYGIQHFVIKLSFWCQVTSQAKSLTRIICYIYISSEQLTKKITARSSKNKITKKAFRRRGTTLCCETYRKFCLVTSLVISEFIN